MWQGINRRQFPRVLFDLSIKLKEKNDHAWRMYTAQNIGVGGLCVLLDQQLPLFSSVSVKFKLPAEKIYIQCDGQVVWHVVKTEIEPAPVHFYDTGIEFINLRDVDRQCIAAYVLTRPPCE